RAILSGGQGKGEDITEAEAMYRYLKARGIDAGRLIREKESVSTWENLKKRSVSRIGKFTLIIRIN
ncbi:MAG: YdcF family protein, partial [Hungatella sp.]|nr:YdcF family protein [Hungatella sp.]